MPKPSRKNKPLAIKLNGSQKLLTDEQVAARIQELSKYSFIAALDLGRQIHSQHIQAIKSRNNYYSLLCDQELKSELLEQTAAILKKAPRDPLALSYHAHALRLFGQNEKALTFLKRLHALKPNDPKVLNTLATAYKVLGDFKEAETLLTKATALKPDYGLAFWNKSDITSSPDEDLKAIQTQLKKPLTDAVAHHLYFSAYRLLDKQGNYSEAFDALKAGNESKRRLLNYLSLIHI